MEPTETKCWWFYLVLLLEKSERSTHHEIFGGKARQMDMMFLSSQLLQKKFRFPHFLFYLLGL